MNAFRLKKQLWRRWRRWKKALWAGAACLLLTVLAWRSMQVPQELSGLLKGSAWNLPESLDSLPAVAALPDGSGGTDDAAALAARAQLLKTVRQEGLSRKVHLKTTYVTGEEVQTLQGLKTAAEQQRLIAGHPDWNGRLDARGDLWLEREVNDLSPLTKKDACFGIDASGNLTLFKGPPGEDQVLRTFFQMDMGSMKSSLPEEILKQLHEGIRVQDIEEYNSVLSTFSDYARDSAEAAVHDKQ